jgi:predicted enzyme related to lactoylglutathione lyase
MGEVLGLGGIFFKCRNKDKLVAWYREFLGFPVADYGGVDFDPKALPENALGVWGAFDATTEYFAPSTKEFMFNLVVDNVEGVLARAKAGGAEIVGEVEEYEYGRFGWFMDPEGNKIELWQPPG